MASPEESEFKLVSLAHKQFKFSVVDAPPKLAKEVRILCDLLNLSCGPIATLTIDDTYFDDSHRTLASQKCSIRRRRIEGKPDRITFKSKSHGEDKLSQALVRSEVEFECTATEFDQMRKNQFKVQIEKEFGGKWCEHASYGQLEKSLTIHNRRIQFPIGVHGHLFCIDNYCFESNDRIISEQFQEIEIELSPAAGSQPTDLEALSKLANILCEIIDFTPEKSSKYGRAVEWLRNRASDFKTVHTLMLDIIKYSSRTADVQKQLIQSLNRITIEALKKHRSQDLADTLCISTGDGMVLVFENHPASLLPLVIAIQDGVRKEFNLLAGERAFDFRSGLHSGPVFKYSDINERLNYAGSGINLAQRAMAPGNAWHILATREARDQIIHENGTFARHFHELSKPLTTKHGEELVVYNVFNSDDNSFGNPDSPV